MYQILRNVLAELTIEQRNFILEGINKYLLSLAKEQIRIAFEQAEKEVLDLYQRTSEGIKTAKLNGKQIGRIKGNKYFLLQKIPIPDRKRQILF